MKKGYEYYTEKPWGYELEVDRAEAYTQHFGATVRKILVVRKDQQLSYQVHKHRNEIWTIKTGRCIITINDVEYGNVLPGTVWRINKGVKHTVFAQEDTVIFEVSNNYYDDDIVRLSDMYGRANGRKVKK